MSKIRPSKSSGAEEASSTYLFSYKKEVLTIDGCIHMAIGFGLAHMICIEGDDGCMIIDTLESNENATEALSYIKKVIGCKPVTAILVTHFHMDHAYGLDAVRKEYPDAKVYMHESTEKYAAQMFNIRGPITSRRTTFQIGMDLPPREVSRTMGHSLSMAPGMTFTKYLNPTHRVSDSMKIKPASNLELELIHCGGETNDHVVAWWPSKRILFPADNIYRSVPNLYTIRGTMARDYLIWVAALDQMRALKPVKLIMQHSLPLEGEAACTETLTTYRDHIQFTHDQTVRYMNKGVYPDAIAHKVKMTPYMKEHPFLRELYGELDWNVRGIFSNYLGWFSGKAADLHPLSPRKQAECLVNLGGGADSVFEKALESFESDEAHWAVQLCDALIEIEEKVDEASTLKAKCLRYMSHRVASSNGRNWYRTAAREAEGIIARPSVGSASSPVQTSKLSELFLQMTTMIDADKSHDVVETVHYRFTDLDTDYVVMLRRGVIELQCDKPTADQQVDLKVTLSDKVFRQILSKQKTPCNADIICEPDADKFATFLSYFDDYA